MRLGSYPCRLVPGTRASPAYGEEMVYERHRHRYEFNNDYRERPGAGGPDRQRPLADGELVEICEMQGPPLDGGLPVPSGVPLPARPAAPAVP